MLSEETIPNRLGYNAQAEDELTGLYYLRARYYNTSLGRFTQEGTISNQSIVYRVIRSDENPSHRQVDAGGCLSGRWPESVCIL